jgi:hypothetical protein
MDHQSDSESVIALTDRLTPVFKIGYWSFDKVIGIRITVRFLTWLLQILLMRMAWIT